MKLAETVAKHRPPAGLCRQKGTSARDAEDSFHGSETSSNSDERVYKLANSSASVEIERLLQHQRPHCAEQQNNRQKHQCIKASMHGAGLTCAPWRRWHPRCKWCSRGFDLIRGELFCVGWHISSALDDLSYELVLIQPAADSR